MAGRPRGPRVSFGAPGTGGACRASVLFARYRCTRDPEVLARALDLVLPALRRLAARLAPAAARDDLVHDSLVAALENIDRYQPYRPVLPWLEGILRNCARRPVRALPGAEAEAVDPGGGPPGIAVGNELRERLRRTLAALPAPCRTVLALRLFLHLDAATIAARLGRPVGTVRNQLRRGIDLLERLLPFGVLASVLLQPARAAAGAVRPRAPAGLRLLGARAGVLAALAGLAAVAVVALVAGAAAPSSGHGHPAGGGFAQVVPEGGRAAPRPAAPASQTLPPAVPSPPRATVGPAAPPSGDVRVRVLDPTGRPVPSVGVRSAERPGRDAAFDRIRAVTDERGVATLRGLPPGPCLLRLDRGAEQQVAVLAGALLELEMTVPAGFEVDGLVRDTAGRPVAGAEIWLSDHPDERMSGGTVARTGGQGAFRLASVHPFTVLRVHAPGFAPSCTHQLFAAAGGRQSLDIALAPGGAGLDVAIADEHGDPVPGVHVTVGTTDQNARGYGRYVRAGGEPARRFVSGGLGRVRVHGLRPGPTLLTLRHPDHAMASVWLQARASPVVEGVVLRRGRSLCIRVRDAEGAARAGARVRAEAGSRLQRFAGVTDEDGRVGFCGVPDGEVAVVAEQDGFSPACAALAADHRGGAVELTLPPLAGLRGLVVDAEGAPLPGHLVGVLGIDPFDGSEREWGARADGEGRFGLFVPAGWSYRVGCRDPASPKVTFADDLGLQRAPAELIVRVPDARSATCRLRARWRGADGRAPAPDLLLLLGLPAGELSAVRPGRTRAAVDLRLPPGSYHLYGCLRGGFVDLGRHSLAPRQELDLGEVALPGPGLLRCRFARADGRALADVHALVCAPSGQPLAKVEAVAAAGPEWVGELAVPPGTFCVAVVGSSFRWLEREPVRIETGRATEVARVLQPACPCELALVLPPADRTLRRVGYEVRAHDRVVAAGERVVIGRVLTLSAVLSPGDHDVRVSEDGQVHRARFTAGGRECAAAMRVVLQ